MKVSAFTSQLGSQFATKDRDEFLNTRSAIESYLLLGEDGEAQPTDGGDVIGEPEANDDGEPQESGS